MQEDPYKSKTFYVKYLGSRATQGLIQRLKSLERHYYQVKIMNLKYLPLIFIFVLAFPVVFGQEISQSMEGSVDIKITYPETAILGRIISIAVYVENNGWEDKKDISFDFFSKDGSIIPISSNEIIIEKLSQGGSFGSNLDFEISENAKPGVHFLNVKYSQILVANNETPQPTIFRDIAIPINLKEQPKVIIYTKTPESIFTNAEFPFEVEIISEDIEITDVDVRIIPPKDIEFRGETLHTFSSIQKETPVAFTSRIITPTHEVNTEYKLPFEIQVKYEDDLGEENTESKTVSLVLRPRTFMEITTDGGIWVGDFFIAPYVSLGTVIGIPAGAILSIIIRRKTAKPKRKRKKT